MAWGLVVWLGSTQKAALVGWVQQVVTSMGYDASSVETVGGVAALVLSLLFFWLVFGEGTKQLKNATLRSVHVGAERLRGTCPSSSTMGSSRILLRKVGDGYTFIHRQLQEYFASRSGVASGPRAGSSSVR